MHERAAPRNEKRVAAPLVAVKNAIPNGLMLPGKFISPSIREKAVKNEFFKFFFTLSGKVNFTKLPSRLLEK